MAMRQQVQHKPLVIDTKVDGRLSVIQAYRGPHATFTFGYTLVGLLPPDAKRDERYVYKVDGNIKLSDHDYVWTVDPQIPPGTYRIGIGFYYHQDSAVIHIV